MSTAKKSSSAKPKASTAAAAAHPKKHGRRNPYSRNLRRMLRTADLKTSAEAKALLLEAVAHNINISRSAAATLASYSGLSTITPVVARAVVALNMSEPDFDETVEAFTAYNNILRGESAQEE